MGILEIFFSIIILWEKLKFPFDLFSLKIKIYNDISRLSPGTLSDSKVFFPEISWEYGKVFTLSRLALLHLKQSKVCNSDRI